MYRRKDPTKAQETKDALCISTWKSSLKGYNSTTCSQELCDFLDERMPGWRVDHHTSKPRSAKGKEKAMRALITGTTIPEIEKYEKSAEKMMPAAKEIVARFLANGKQYPSLKFDCRTDPSRAQEYADAKKLHDWKSHADVNQAAPVLQYLDEHMPNWKSSHITTTTNKRKNAPISKAREIFRRCGMRGGALPRFIHPNDQTSAELMLEHTDAVKLLEWKESLEARPAEFCPLLKKFLNSKLEHWSEIGQLIRDDDRKGFNLKMSKTNRNEQKEANKGTDDEESSDGNSSNAGCDENSSADCGSNNESDTTSARPSKRKKVTSESSSDDTYSNAGSDEST